MPIASRFQIISELRVFASWAQSPCIVPFCQLYLSCFLMLSLQLRCGGKGISMGMVRAHCRGLPGCSAVTVEWGCVGLMSGELTSAGGKRQYGCSVTQTAVRERG